MAKIKRIPSEAYWKQILTLIPVYINVFMMGCTLSWTANAILFFQLGKEVAATPSELSLFASSLELGRLLLAIPSGILADRFGRKKITISAGLLNFLCLILLSITSSTNAILFARFGLGIFTALVNATSLVTIGEIASPAIRAELSSIYHIFFTSGLVSQSVISILFSSYFVLSYVTLALSCTFFISMSWILETPHYLISVSKIQEARKNLKYVRRGYPEEEIDFEFSGMQTYILKERKEKQQVDWLHFLKSKSIRKPLITAVLISFYSYAVGIGLIISFITLIIPENETISSEYYPLVVQLTPFLLSLVAPLFVEKYPRRTIFLVGAALVFFTNVFLAWSSYCFMKWRSDTWRWIFTGGNLLLGLITKGCVQPMTNIMKSEVFPQSVKGFGSSLCIIAQALANIILFQSYNYITTTWGQHCVYLNLAANSAILYILIYFRLPEARGRYLADLQTRPDEPTTGETQTHYGNVDEQRT